VTSWTRNSLASRSTSALALPLKPKKGKCGVSGTVRNFVAGSGIEFDSKGVRELKGLGDWPLYAVVTA
jgi:hypothetical protein